MKNFWLQKQELLAHIRFKKGVLHSFLSCLLRDWRPRPYNNGAAFYVFVSLMKFNCKGCQSKSKCEKYPESELHIAKCPTVGRILMSDRVVDKRAKYWKRHDAVKQEMSKKRYTWELI